MKPLLIVLKKNAISLLFFALVFILFSTILLVLFDGFVYPCFKKYQAFNQTRSDFAILFNGELNKQDTIIYCNNNIIIYPAQTSNSSFYSEVYMQKDGFSDNFISYYYNKHLQANEIVLSENVAKKLHKSKGDIVFIETGYTLSRLEYVIADVIDNVPSIFGKNNQYISIVGNNIDYINNTNIQTVLFYQGDMSEIEFSANYVNMVNFKDSASVLLLKFLLMIVGIILANILILYILFRYQNKMFIPILMKYKVIGKGKFYINVTYCFLQLIVFLPQLLVPLALSTLFTGYKMFLLLNCCVLFGAVGCLFLYVNSRFKTIMRKV